MNEHSVTDTVLMIRPARFGANAETAVSNRFQQRAVSDANTAAVARREFDSVVGALKAAEIRVEVFEDNPEPWTPDAVFPNNWISFHYDGTVCLYPMQAQNRRLERRHDILQALEKQRGYRIAKLEDFSPAEQGGKYLEGTGSLVLDRAHRLAYACLSTRTDEALTRNWCERLNYQPVLFHATDAEGTAVYHTNVMMCIGEQFAVICLESIADAAERKRVSEHLEATGHRIVAISRAQMARFAGNMLLLSDRYGGRVLVMSARAEQVLDTEQRRVLQDSARIVNVPLTTIEDCAGGSMRCMIAELFLPRN